MVDNKHTEPIAFHEFDGEGQHTIRPAARNPNTGEVVAFTNATCPNSSAAEELAKEWLKKGTDDLSKEEYGPAYY